MSLKLKLNKERMLSDGTYPLVFQVILGRRKKLIYTSFRLHEREFRPESERVCACRGGLSRAGAASANRALAEQRGRIDELLRRVRLAGGGADDFAAAYRGEGAPGGLFAFVRAEIARCEAARRQGTAAAYRSTLHSLRRFTAGREPALREVDARFVREYVLHLRGRGLRENTVSFYLRNFRALYNRSFGEAPPRDPSPFRHAPIRMERTAKRAVTAGQLARIRDLPLEGSPALAFSRDLFLFGFYARGMALVDVLSLRRDQLEDGRFTYLRAKTRQPIVVGLNDPLREIVGRYRNAGPYLFPVGGDPCRELTYRDYRTALGRVNRHLKILSRMAGLEVPITFYVARHTWATLARDVGTPVAVISEALGHTSERTTRIYLRRLDGDLVDRANRWVIRALENPAPALDISPESPTFVPETEYLSTIQ